MNRESSHESGAAAESPFIDSANSMAAVGEEVPWARPAPPRRGCRVAPLIDAQDMYPRLENLILDAERSFWMAFRVFDPNTRTRSTRARNIGLEDWSDLLRHAVRRGVEIRILLSDFEPVMADYLHAGSWCTYRGVRSLHERLSEEERRRLQLIIIQHEGEIGSFWRFLLRPLLRRRSRHVIEKLLGRDTHEDGGFDTRPGLWRFLDWDKKEPGKWRFPGAPRLWPATYHQKFVVADGRHAVIGGLDLDERRWDDHKHRRPADQTWHDVSALLEGPVVADVARHFARLWNLEIPRYRRTVDHWTASCGRRLTLGPLARIDRAAPAPPAAAGKATVQFVRTVSRRSNPWFAVGPRPAVRELMAAHREIIGRARRMLYIEGQFFRSKRAAKWVEAALDSNPELEVVILIANVPEEIAFEGQADNLAHRHGEHLQARALGRLFRKAGPRRIGLFTLAKSEPAKGREKRYDKDRGTAYGSGLIHIHAKLLIADDRHCLLSSANINGRSFSWDTEAGIIWSEAGEAIAAFRRSLWATVFAEEVPENLDAWRDIARRNANCAPGERRGFVLPYQLGRARRFGRPYWFVPDDMV